MSLLSEVERVLCENGALAGRLEAVAALVGARLDADRVMIYGNSEPGDAAVRVRVGWHAGAFHSNELISAIPLLTERPRDRAIFVSAPRGVQCPSDCHISLADCDLRGACASLIEPLRIGDRTYGSLAVHATTGRAWSDDEQSLVSQLAYRIALEIARSRQEVVDREMAAERSGIAMTALHQLATPATVLGCAIDELTAHGRGAREHPNLEMLIEIAREECVRLRRLCDDISALATSHRAGESGRCDVVTEVSASVSAARDEHPGVVIAITVVGEIPLVRGAGRALRRMLRELIDNACRYCPAPVHIDLIVSVSSDTVRVRLRDDGPGISPEQANRIGQAFTRLDPNMRIHPGGAGLGLAIVRQLAAQDGGNLEVAERTDATGTQVTIVLPIYVAGALAE